MKKFLLSLFVLSSLVLTTEKTSAQSGVVQLFAENFDSLATQPWRRFTRTSTATTTNPKWDTTSFITKSNSPFAMWDTTGHRNTQYMTSPNIYIKDFVSVGLGFDHICYIQTNDDARVEVSFDGGPWIKTGPATYEGPSLLKSDSSFSKISNAVLWKFQDTSFVFAPNTNAWVREDFNFTPLIVKETNSNGGVSPDSMSFRFSLEDDPGSSVGRVGSHIWYVDDIVVRGAPCELVPPVINLLDPANYLDKYEDRVYYTGPYDFTAIILDQSLVDTAYIVTQIKRPGYTSPFDTIGLARIGGGNFFANLEIANVGDTVCWKIVAIDASDCKNEQSFPSSGFQKFEVRGNIPLGCSTTPVSTFPYIQTFDGANFTVGSSGVLGEDWQNTSGDFHDWWVNSGTTPTSTTGPSDDFPGGGKYLFMEATDFRNKTAVLITPCFDFYELESGLVRFYVNMNTDGGDTIHVDLFDPDDLSLGPNGGYVKDIVAPISGARGDNWIPIEFNTYNYRDRITQMRFRGMTNRLNDNSDIAIDSFKIEYSPIIDLRANDIDIAPFNPTATNDAPDVVIRNLGATSATTAEIYYSVDIYNRVTLDYDPIDTLGPVQWNGNLGPDGQDTISMASAPYIVPRGKYQLTAWINHANDEVAQNDTINRISHGLYDHQGRIYADKFDDENLWLTLPDTIIGIAGNIWELGTPNYQLTNTAFSEPNSWDINLDRGYNATGNTNQLITPFFDFSSGDSVIMDFYSNRQMVEQTDGVYLEYSFDRGYNWDTVSTEHDTAVRLIVQTYVYKDVNGLDSTILDTVRANKKNWYNSNLSGPLVGGTPTFSGDSRYLMNQQSGWAYSELMLPDTFNFKPEVIFRFNFYAEGKEEGGGTGMSIDNFNVYVPFDNDAATFKIITPRTQCDLRNDERILATFQNKGESIISELPVKYIIDGPVGQEVKFDTIRKNIYPRDTIRHNSVPTFDFLVYGDYTIRVITDLPNEEYTDNDTVTTTVENIRGCYLDLELSATAVTGAVRDSAKWRFYYTNGDREYIVTRPYARLTPSDINVEEVCIKTGNSDVTFSLGDPGSFTAMPPDNGISFYSLIAFNGERDTILVNSAPGSFSAPNFKFNWDCPPLRSTTIKRLIIDKNKRQLPIAKDYQFEVVMQNDGLDSIRKVNLHFQIDSGTETIEPLSFPAPQYIDGLKYYRRYKHDFGFRYLSPGIHTITTWTSLPNDSMDLAPWNDTLSKIFRVIDTIQTIPNCEDFEGNSNIDWVSLNPYTYRQDNESFEHGVPNGEFITTANSGTQAWMTDLDSSFRQFDSASVISPFFKMEKDSCYQLTFNHQFVFDDLYHDGGHVQITLDTGETWTTLPKNEDLDSTLQLNWYNSEFIVAIPIAEGNAGWSGISNGWIESKTVIPAYEDAYGLLRWRSEADGVDSSDGWAIDDVCLDIVSSTGCFPTGIDKHSFENNKFQIGQNIPNPVSGRTKIPFYLPNSGNLRVEVMNMIGQPVFEKELYRSSGNHLMDMDMNDFKNGIYFYTFIFEGEKQTGKMLISK